MDKLKSELLKYIYNPFDPITLINTGYEYEKMGQQSSAFSFYLRCAEIAEDINVRYEALIRGAITFRNLSRRKYTVYTLLKNAISLIPIRHEAYYVLAHFHEFHEEWLDAYTMASIGHVLSKVENEKLLTNIDYLGEYQYIFIKARSVYFIGRIEESKELMYLLQQKYSDVMDYAYKVVVDNNINTLGLPKRINDINT